MYCHFYLTIQNPRRQKELAPLPSLSSLFTMGVPSYKDAVKNEHDIIQERLTYTAPSVTIYTLTNLQNPEKNRSFKCNRYIESPVVTRPIHY